MKFDSEFFDVVVADYKVPGMNGIEFLEMIRSDDKLGNIHFILFTGAGGLGIAKEALKQGTAGTLQGVVTPQFNLTSWQWLYTNWHWRGERR
ncbi:MAG: response regulator [Methanophagales archaeon]|nr:response regulator [Methanophagales archaeon]MCW7072915.1 response regulator [Methanophagales archaeon]